MSGFDSMVKNILGIDPKELRARIKEALPMLQNMAGEVQKTLTHFDARMNALESGQKEILALLRSKDKPVVIDAAEIEGLSNVGPEKRINGTGKRTSTVD